MPLVVTSVPNLAQGVSQQPDNLRYPGQCDEQINAWSTVVEGLVKRPNTRWVNQFNSETVDADDQSKLFTHFVKRDEDNKYCVTVSLGTSTPSLYVINLETGNKVSVAVTSIARNYLTGISNPLADLRALTVADYTFLVNKKKTVAKDTDRVSETPEKEALVSVKLGDYEKAYSVYINDSLVPLASTIATNPHSYTHHGHQPATYISGPSSGTGAGKYADTEYIAKDLYECIDEEYASGPTTGIASVSISNGGSGWFKNLVYWAERDLPTIIPHKVIFRVSQTDSGTGILNQSAYGDAEFDDTGVITSATLVNTGSGYNTSDPLMVTFYSQLFIGGSRAWISADHVYNTLPSQPTATATTGSFSAFEVEREGSVIKIRPGNRDFRIRVEDGLANQGLGLAYKEVDSIVDLPKSCFNGFTIKVKGDADIDQDDYYVTFKVKDASNFGEGSWVETVGWRKDESETEVLEGIETHLKPETMPITLVPVFTGSDITSFKLQRPQEDQTVVAPNEIGWRSRKAGDDATNPFPSFVGKTINDVFFFKNRLGFLTDSNVIFSEADEYFNFFRTTTQQLLDSAPIDVGLSHTKVAVLQYALPFQEKLVLFSKQSQFVLRGADVLSPKTVAISPVTEYDISDGIAPLALGSYIYFPFNRGQYEGMFEYFVDNNTEVFEAEEITSQIPKYIPSKLRAMAGSASESMVLLQNATDLKTLYVYKYFWSGKEKIQSAWQKWTFNDNVTGFDFIDSTLYLILNSQQLVQMPVENALTDEGLDYTLLLDNRVDGSVPTVSYNSTDNETTISNLPDGYGVEVTTDVDGNVTSTNVAVYTKGGSGRKVSGSGADTTVKIDGFIASYVDNGGDYVEYGGDYYYCIISHTSASTFESKYWRKAAYPPSDTPNWSASTSYNRGTIYKCELNHTSPSTFAAVDTSVIPNIIYWSVSTEVPSAPEWGSNIFYNNDRYFVVGKPYNMLYRFSNQALKQPTERGGRSASDYTYQTIRNASIEYADTGHFTVEVTPRFRDKYTYVYNPALLSSISTLDRFTPESGHFRFGVQCRPKEATIEVKSSSALPVKLLAAEFESMVTGRSKRYGA